MRAEVRLNIYLYDSKVAVESKFQSSSYTDYEHASSTPFLLSMSASVPSPSFICTYCIDVTRGTLSGNSSNGRCYNYSLDSSSFSSTLQHRFCSFKEIRLIIFNFKILLLLPFMTIIFINIKGMVHTEDCWFYKFFYWI